MLFADDLKLIVNANLPHVTQDDLDLLSMWQKQWLLSFNTVDAKCKVLEVSMKGRSNHTPYTLNGSVLPVVDTEKDLGVNVKSNLKWDYHISQNIAKAKQCIGWVNRNVITRDAKVMSNIYKSLIRPHLEYCVQLWAPVPEHGSWATVMELESVQRQYTRLIDGVGLMPYKERLSELKLTTLLERRARGDLIEVFKIFTNQSNFNYGKDIIKFSTYGGMNIVLKGNNSLTNKFQVRVHKYWNKLPDDVKLSANVIDFKINLEAFKSNNIQKEGNFWELSDEVFNRINDKSHVCYEEFMMQHAYIAKRRGINIK